ncbi:MAG: hypothetical protein J5J00_03460 [Deltaproteobacteria bacterium]|nr:hypothetical protein [Deltaproteobacteria bacterium]
MARVIASLLVIMTATLLPAAVSAQTRTVDVHVPGNFQVHSAVGLIFTQGKTLQKNVEQVDQGDEDTMVVTFSYDASEDGGDSYASAMVISSEGDVRFGDIKLLAGSLTNRSFYSLPDCPPKELSRSVHQEQTGLIESLVEIRAARREAHQLRIKTVMSGPFLEKLRRLEKGFGFQYNKPLSPNLTAFELMNRLSRLVNAIKNYQSGSPSSSN